MIKFRQTALIALLLGPFVTFGQQKWSETRSDDFVLVTNRGGRQLAYAPESGVKLLTVNGLAFKDLNKNGTLDTYEDWRLPVAVRAKALAAKLSVEQIAGLMLYSRHQSIPAAGGGYMGGTYGKKLFAESGAKAFDLTDQQTEFLQKDNLRHVLITTVQSPEVAAQWNNKAQALAEGLGVRDSDQYQHRPAPRHSGQCRV